VGEHLNIERSNKMTKLRFEELGLSKETLTAIKDMGFEEASPIQSEAIPILLSGKDLIGQAQTGTGKTAAFAIPLIERLDPESKELQAVILCPTRELVIQVSEEFRKLMKYKENLWVIPVYGGQEIERQLRTLKRGVQVVIGTPGRTMDHMRRGSIKMNSVKTVVLDEADEMLDMGFREDMETILKDSQGERQTIMFSATMAKDILELTKQYQKDPVIVNVTNKKINAPKIQQVYFEIQEKNKPEVLARLLDIHNVKLALVFCNTKSQVDQLVNDLKTRGYFADALHGDMSQNQRDKVMNGFRNGSVEILVATDVAGRGIDVNDIEAVFNYDLPRDDEDYTHRIGRTARAGKTGTAFTFVTGKQVYNLKRIERANGIKIQRQSVPTIDEIELTKINSYASKITEIIEAGHLSKYVNQIELFMGEEYTSLDIAAALLKITIEKENEGFDHTVDFEAPIEEVRPPRRSSDNRSNKFAKFEKEDRRSGFPRRKGNDSQDKPFDGQKRAYDRKNESEKEYKPSRPAGRRNDSFRDSKPFDGEKKTYNRKNEGEPEYKPFRSSDNRKSDSTKGDKPYNRANSDNKSALEKDGSPSRYSGKNRNDSYKETGSSRKKYGKPGENKKPGNKFGKNK